MMAAGVWNVAGNIEAKLYPPVAESPRSVLRREAGTTASTLPTVARLGGRQRPGCYDSLVRRALTSATIIGAGLLLLIWLVLRADPRQIWALLQQIGWGVVAILAIAGLRFAVRAVAWMRCLEPPHRLRFTEAFTAVLCGDALGNATPLGPLVSEPAKVAFVRDRVPMGVAFTALAIENVFYTLSVAAMIAAGITALLLRGGLERELRLAAEVGIGLVLVIYVAATWVLMRQPAVLSRIIAIAARLVPALGRPHRIAKVERLEQEIYTFAARRPATAGAIVVAELIFHALGVLEVYVSLWLLTGGPPSLVTSFILETANRLIIVLFKFIPMQQPVVGGAATVLVARALGLRQETALALAIVRGGRMLFWQLAGTLLLVRHGMTTRRILQDHELQTSRNAARG
jgi:hypothetical protein